MYRLVVEAGVCRILPAKELKDPPTDGIHSSGSIRERLAPTHRPANYSKGVRFELLLTGQAGGDKGIVEGRDIKPIIIVDLAHEVVPPPTYLLLACQMVAECYELDMVGRLFVVRYEILEYQDIAVSSYFSVDYRRPCHVLIATDDEAVLVERVRGESAGGPR